MPLSRDAIAAALFTRLSSKVTLCKTFSRKWLEAQQVPIEQQPALLCLEGSETPHEMHDDQELPPVWTLEFAVVVYARTNDTPIPGKVLSDILDQIEGALERSNTEGGMPGRYHTTLGIQNVQRVWIAGAVQKEDGMETGGQAWMSLPIHILAVP